jgi:predicted alpha/beta hydrolase family esterase
MTSGKMAEIVSDPVRPRVARAPWPLVHLVVVSGLSPVDVDPWQAWLEARFPQATWVRPLDGDWPDVDRWAERIDEALDHGGPVAPRLVLSHGFGALAAIRHAASGGQPVSAALLVTPAHPRRFALEGGRLVNRVPYPAALLAPLGGAHEESPWLQDDDAVDWAERWGCHLVDAGRGPVRHAHAVPGATPPWAEAEAVLGATMAPLLARARAA